MEQNKISGVYKITNNITGDFYIGSSKDIKRRWGEHRRPSCQAQNPNSRLYQDMNKYGLDQFKFEILEQTTEEELKNREQYYIEQLSPSYNNYQAQGVDIERYKETSKRCNKEWHKANRNEHLSKMKAYRSRLCLYEGETLTLKALSIRFCKQGIPHATLKAKEYLIERSI